MDDDRFKLAKNRQFIGLERQIECNDDLEYTFLQLADTQLGMLPGLSPMQWLRRVSDFLQKITFNLIDLKLYIPLPRLLSANEGLNQDELLNVEIELAKCAVNCINSLRPKPRFAIICGDLVHSYPDHDPAKNAAQVQIFKSVFSKIDPDITLVCICGNHDLSERPTPALLELWKTRFGDDHFSFWVGNDKFITVNSQLYKDSSGATECAEEQDVWLDEELSDTQGGVSRRHCVVFSHIPPFIDDPEEEDGYFPLARSVRLKLLERMSQAKVSHWFCGHFHRNAGGVYKELEVVTTAAVGGNIITGLNGKKNDLQGIDGIVGSKQYSGLRICKVTKNGIEHRFQTFEELSQSHEIA